MHLRVRSRAGGCAPHVLPLLPSPPPEPYMQAWHWGPVILTVPVEGRSGLLHSLGKRQREGGDMTQFTCLGVQTWNPPFIFQLIP